MHKTKSKLIAYLVLRALVVVVLIRELFMNRWDNVFLCILTLALFLIPSIVERRLKLELPSLLEIVTLVFIFAAEILGEIAEFYLRVRIWDTLLHIVNGFIMAGIGFAMIDILNRHPRFHINLSPAFVAFVAFCFSMTIGVFWEFIEYGVDQLLSMDMQKDTIIRRISSVALNPAGVNIPVVAGDIQRTVIIATKDGVVTEIVVEGGYLDVGIIDTMKDLLVNCIGALVFSVLGAFYIQGRGRVAGGFIPKLLSEKEIEAEKVLLKAQRERGRFRLRRLAKKFGSGAKAPQGEDIPPP